MSDATFERSLTALTIVVVLAVIAAIASGLFNIVWAIVVGLVIELVGGGALLYFWGKDYLSRS